MRIAVACGGSTGVHKLRAEPLAKHLGCPLFDTSQPITGRFDTIILIKRPLGEVSSIRKACERLIWDPLDCWRHTRKNLIDPARYWQMECESVRPDELIATSPACLGTMQATGLPVSLVPHACDPSIEPTWYNRHGPIVYYGYPSFIGPVMADLFDAAWAIGRRFVPVDFRVSPVSVLKGACLHLCLRMRPHDYPLNRFCKPQVKLENAAAAGAPVMVSGHPCAASLRSEAFCISHKRPRWARLLRQAIDSPRLSDPYTMEKYLSDLDRVIYGTS